MLPQIEELHRIAHDLPDGVMLVIEPAEGHPQREIYEKVIPMLQAAVIELRFEKRAMCQRPNRAGWSKRASSKEDMVVDVWRYPIN